MALTSNQQMLADLLFTTKTHAKVLRRKTNRDGTYEFYHIERDTSPIDFPATEEEFAIKVHEKRPDAPLSPIYVNLRNLPDDLLNKIATVLAEVPIEEQIDVCTGIPKTAIMMAQKFSDVSHIPFIDVFEKVGEDTNRKIVIKDGAAEGNGKRLLIIDDVVSQGGSKVEAIKAAEDLGYKVSILVLIDREQGGAEQLRSQGYPVHAAFTLSQLLDGYREAGRITKEQYEKVYGGYLAMRKFFRVV